MRAIDADKFKQVLEVLCKDEKNPLNITAIAYFALVELIDNMPTIEAEPDKMLRDTAAELCEAKRLLKVAVEDIHELLCDKKNLDGNGQSCNICSYIEHCSCCKECTIREDLRNWRYADEVLKLIGEDGDKE